MSLIIRLFEGSGTDYERDEAGRSGLGNRRAVSRQRNRRAEESVGTYHFARQFPATSVATPVKRSDKTRRLPPRISRPNYL